MGGRKKFTKLYNPTPSVVRIARVYRQSLALCPIARTRTAKFLKLSNFRVASLPRIL